MTSRIVSDRWYEPPRSLLAIGIELNRVRVCLLEWIGDAGSGGYRLAGWLNSAGDELIATPRSGSQTDETSGLSSQIQLACEHLGTDLGRRLWDHALEQPFQETGNPITSPPLGQVVCLASPLPRLRTWLTGFTPSRLQLAVDAAHSSMAAVTSVYPLTSHPSIADLSQDILAAIPQVVLITGGHDDPSPAAIGRSLALAEQVGRAMARLPHERRPALIYAGNRWAAESVFSRLQGKGVDKTQPRIDLAGPVAVVDNIYPSPARIQPEPLARTIHKLYWSTCRDVSGVAQLAARTAAAVPIEGVDWGFAQLVRIWLLHKNLPYLHGLYCGQGWWQHVLALPTPQGAHISVQFTDPYTRPTAVSQWPPPQLVSGVWPETQWPRAKESWSDMLGLAPLMMPIAQFDPVAALRVLSMDILSGPD